MASVKSAIEQVRRYVSFMAQYIMELTDNLRLEAEHGLSDDPDWHLSDRPRLLAGGYGGFLRDGLHLLEGEAAEVKGKQAWVQVLKRRRAKLKQRLNLEEKDPFYHPFASRTNAEWEIHDVLLELLANRVYIPHSYGRWVRSGSNRRRTRFYVADEGVLQGAAFLLDRLTRLVLFHDRLEVRWMGRRVVLSIPYDIVVRVERHRKKRRTIYRFVTIDGSKYALDVSGVWNLAELQEHLASKCSFLIPEELRPTTGGYARRKRDEEV